MNPETGVQSTFAKEDVRSMTVAYKYPEPEKDVFYRSSYKSAVLQAQRRARIKFTLESRVPL